jgi:calcineurin-like phosphoesterase family protein
MNPADRRSPGGADRNRARFVVPTVIPVVLVLVIAGCARMGRLQYVEQPVAHVQAGPGSPVPQPPMRALFANDSLIGFVPQTGDSTRRYLGRLNRGFTADTLNLILCGDNRPAYRTTRLRPEYQRVKHMFSLNPVKIASGLLALPVILVKGMIPDLGLVRDVVPAMRRMPTYGGEKDVNKAMLAKLDSLERGGETVAALINTGDLVKDGRYPAHWNRFLGLVQPLSSRVPYLAVAGNHERTDTEDGLANWWAGTGLPISGDRLYYCFDSADGWVRFIALDSNPMTDPANHYSREVEVRYSDEQIDWMVARLKEHRGPAFVFLHNPPFSAGYHRVEWQNDAVLRERRERMVRALYEAKIGIIASGHEHAYQRAIFTWPDAVLINLVTGGAGSPLHNIPGPAQSAALYSEYRVAGSVVKPENVYTGRFYHFIHMRLWFGGGEFFTYAVDGGKVRLADHVSVDLERYGVPEVDQQKMPVPQGKPQPQSEDPKKSKSASVDSTSASKRIESSPPPATR